MKPSALLKLFALGLVSVCSMHAQNAAMLTDEAKQAFNQVSNNLLQSAREMPAADYAFQPTRESPTFADLIDQVIASHADACSAIRRRNVDMERPLTNSKSDLVAALAKSVQDCTAAYASVNDFNAMQSLRFGGVSHSRLGLLFMNTSHDDELYGQMAVYLRMKGLLPPSEKARAVPIAAH